jgi:hypothetical protein
MFHVSTSSKKESESQDFCKKFSPERDCFTAHVLQILKERQTREAGRREVTKEETVAEDFTNFTKIQFYRQRKIVGRREDIIIVI